MLHDQLGARGIAAVAAHPHQVKLIWHARCKTDSIDARKLAELARTGLRPAVWVPSPEIRARRKLLRGRGYMVRVRTQFKNRIHGHLTAENRRPGVTDLYGRAGRAWLAAVPLSPMGRVKQLVRCDAAARLLQTWPEIGAFGAALLLVEIGTMTRFRSSHALAAYAGLVPSARR